jgi:hypothetical protein
LGIEPAGEQDSQQVLLQKQAASVVGGLAMAVAAIPG